MGVGFGVLVLAEWALSEMYSDYLKLIIQLAVGGIWVLFVPRVRKLAGQVV